MIKIILTLAVAAHAFAGDIRERDEGEIELQESQVTVSKCSPGSAASIVDRDDSTYCGLQNDPDDDGIGYIGARMEVQLDKPHCIKKIIHLKTADHIVAGFTCTNDGCKCTEEKFPGPCSKHELHVGDEDMSGNTPQDDCRWLSSFRYERSGSSSMIQIYDLAVIEKEVVEDTSDDGEGGEGAEGAEGADEGGEGGEHQQYSGQSGLASSICIAATVIGLFQLY